MSLGRLTWSPGTRDSQEALSGGGRIHQRHMFFQTTLQRFRHTRLASILESGGPVIEQEHTQVSKPEPLPHRPVDICKHISKLTKPGAGHKCCLVNLHKKQLVFWLQGFATVCKCSNVSVDSIHARLLTRMAISVLSGKQAGKEVCITLHKPCVPFV